MKHILTLKFISTARLARVWLTGQYVGFWRFSSSNASTDTSCNFSRVHGLPQQYPTSANYEISSTENISVRILRALNGTATYVYSASRKRNSVLRSWQPAITGLQKQRQATRRSRQKTVGRHTGTPATWTFIGWETLIGYFCARHAMHTGITSAKCPAEQSITDAGRLSVPSFHIRP